MSALCRTPTPQHYCGLYEDSARGSRGSRGCKGSLEGVSSIHMIIFLDINTIKTHCTILTDMLPQTNCIEFKGSNIHFNL